MDRFLDNKTYILARPPKTKRQKPDFIFVGTMDEIKNLNPDIKILNNGEVLFREERLILI